MRYSQLIIYGFSIFSMFFGSGNLVFPLKIGVETQAHWFWGFAGLFITGILLPLMGLIVIKINKGSAEQFFGKAGWLAQQLLPLVILSLLGSFGVLPRCIIVAFGGIKYLWPQANLILFGAVFSIVCYIICLKERWLMAMIGKILTPILLIFLFVLIACSIYHAPQDLPVHLSPYDCFLNGFLQGYETMDLFAAFFFSAMIFKQIEADQLIISDKMVFKTAIISSLIGIFLLATVYYAFIYMGAAFTNVAAQSLPENILPTISFYVLGDKASSILSLVIILSCLTTAVALNNIYAHYIVKAAALPPARFPMILMLTTGTAFLLSNLEFKGISTILEPILQVSYPALIALTIMNMAFKNQPRTSKVAFYSVITLAIACKIF